MVSIRLRFQTNTEYIAQCSGLHIACCVICWNSVAVWICLLRWFIFIVSVAYAVSYRWCSAIRLTFRKILLENFVVSFFIRCCYYWQHFIYFFSSLFSFHTHTSNQIAWFFLSFLRSQWNILQLGKKPCDFFVF